MKNRVGAVSMLLFISLTIVNHKRWSNLQPSTSEIIINLGLKE
ncbi:hypothetical protein [Halosquirtibacter xylanolyticus]